ncbi:MAG: nitronate monooxygenase [Flavobacteriales bacterium]|nr:nitronate monooxygenase [Flavobacteriales bacterium]MCB9363078.1 nitronate monooxygenase [Flavobacteriales bacterium]
MKNIITTLFNIEFPIVQGGMIWNSGWRLAAAVSNNGGLGLIGAGSMYPEVFRKHVQKCKKATNKPFGVNLPMLYPQIDELINIILEEDIKIVFTSAGNPKKYTSFFQEKGITVVHVVPGLKFALKAQDAGVDAVVVEGFEAGGHNGRDETTTFCLVPMVKKELSIPIIAAGGIATGKGMLSAMVLGADGVQMGSRFAASIEASSHQNFKDEIVKAKEGDTLLTLKDVTPVRLLKNDFFEKINNAIAKGATPEEQKEILGRGRAKKGMFEGDLIEGELEIGQIAGLIDSIEHVDNIIKDIITEYREALEELKADKYRF